MKQDRQQKQEKATRSEKWATWVVGQPRLRSAVRGGEGRKELLSSTDWPKKGAVDHSINPKKPTLDGAIQDSKGGRILDR